MTRTEVFLGLIDAWQWILVKGKEWIFICFYRISGLSTHRAWGGSCSSGERSRWASLCRWTWTCSVQGSVGRHCRSCFRRDSSRSAQGWPRTGPQHSPAWCQRPLGCFRGSLSHAMCQWTRWRCCQAGTFPIPPSDSGEQVTEIILDTSNSVLCFPSES